MVLPREQYWLHAARDTPPSGITPPSGYTLDF